MNLFNFSLRLNGFPIGKATKLLADIQLIPDEDYKGYLERKKKEILSFHLKNNLFYKDFTKDSDLSKWENVPITTKRYLQQPLEKRLSKGFTSQNVYVNKTSGSSGDPFIFAKDKFCHALTWALIQDRFAYYNIDLNKSKQARFYGIPLDKKNDIKLQLKCYLIRIPPI